MKNQELQKLSNSALEKLDKNQDRELSQVVNYLAEESIKLREKRRELDLPDNDNSILTKVFAKYDPLKYSLPTADVVSVVGVIAMIIGHKSGIITTSPILSIIICTLLGGAYLGLALYYYMFDDKFKNPSKLYKFLVMISPRGRKKYRLARQYYSQMLLNQETYGKYYRKKMKKIQPILDSINDSLEGVIINLNADGELKTAITEKSSIKLELMETIENNLKGELLPQVATQ